MMILSLRDPNVYAPFDDPDNPTFDRDHEVLDGVLRLGNFAPSAFDDTMFVPLRGTYGDCTGLLDIGEAAFATSLGQLLAYHDTNKDRLFRGGIRIYLNGGIAGRQSVRRFHWRCIGMGQPGGDMGPYRTRNDREVVGLDQFPHNFTVEPQGDDWQVVPYPTPHAGIDVLVVPPTTLWQDGGLAALGQDHAEMRNLLLTLRRLMAGNPLHFAWGYRLLILVGSDARQSPISGLPFEIRLLAGGITPGDPLPVPCYQDLGRYSMVPGLPEESRRTGLVELLDRRARELGVRVVPSYWGEALAKTKAAFSTPTPVAV